MIITNAFPDDPDDSDGLEVEPEDTLGAENYAEPGAKEAEEFYGAEYAEPGTEEDFLVKRAAWERGELSESDLPQGAISFDTRGRKLIFGTYEPKRGRDADLGVKRTPADFGTAVSPNWKPSTHKPLPSVRCVVIKKDGNRCGRWSIRGATVCLSHGGQLPNVKKHAAAAVETARMRLVDMTDEAVSVLIDLTSPGTSDAIRLKAATEILDRAGIKGGMDINIEVEHKIDAGKTIADRLEQITSRNVIDAGEVDAEVVDDESGGEERA